MFINLSNHPSSEWSEEQMAAAVAIGGEVVDIPFPEVDPNADEVEIDRLGYKCVERIVLVGGLGGQIVHVMGEMTLTHNILERLHYLHIRCYASTTERNVTINADGSKTSTFRFVRFREYRPDKAVYS